MGTVPASEETIEDWQTKRSNLINECNSIDQSLPEMEQKYNQSLVENDEIGQLQERLSRVLGRC